MGRNARAFATSLRTIVSSGLMVAIVLIVGAGALRPTVVYAGVTGQGTATINIGTGGTNASDATYGGAGASGSVTVGTKSYIRLDLTVGTGHIAASQNNVTVQINTNLFATNTWDNVGAEAALSDLNTVGEWFISYTDTDAGTTNNAAISFAASAAVNTGLITIQADQQMDETDIISIYGVVIDSNYVLAAADVEIKTDNTGGDDASLIGVPPTIATVAADPLAAIDFQDPTVGATGEVTLTSTLPFALDAADSFVLTFPAHINVSGVDSAVTGTIESSDSITCSPALQVVTCTTTAVTNASGTIIMTGITGGYSSGIDSVSLSVVDESVLGNNIATDTISLGEIFAADAAATVTLGTNATVGVTGTTTVALTLPFALDANDTIAITFPANMNVASVASAVTGTLESSDSITCAVASQIVTCTTTAATNTSGTIIMTGIKASYAATTDISTFVVVDEGVPGNNIALDSSVAMTNTRINSTDSSSSSSTPLTYGVSFTSPSAADVYMPGDDIAVTWSSTGTGTFGFVNLWYSVDGGSNWTLIAANEVNDGSYSWTAPDIAVQSVMLEIDGTDLVTALATDESDAFSIGTGDVAPAEDVDTSEDSTELLPAGTYMRSPSWTTVYYIGADGTRHPFLDSQTFFTYAENFDDVVTVADGYLANYMIGTPMLPQAGTVLVKIQSVNSVYALEADNTLRWITSESLATTLYGSNWADYVIDVPVTAWGHFNHGDDINSASDISVNRGAMQTRNALNSK